MALYTTLASLSQTPASNAADGTSDPPSTIDNQTNLLASFTAQLRDGIGFTVPLGNKNRIINGNFWINQRGVSGTVTLAAGIYGHDRWKAGAAGCTYTFATSGLDTTVTITAGSLMQVIEGALIEGGTYAMSWAGTSTGKIAGGTYSASGVTSVGVTGATNLTVEFSTGTLTRVQVEVGTTATPFDRRPIQYDFILAQRYYEAGNASLYGYGLAGVTNAYRVSFKVTKRTTPTMFYGAATATNVSPFDAISPDAGSFLWRCVTTATAGFIWDGNWTASAEL